jgi:2-polyprenyl-6-methoxyphenol hydroxylase-like FAD-dependent oxidoreductase
MTTMSTPGSATRLVERYRVGRVLLAGDAAYTPNPARRPCAGCSPS